MYIRPKTYGNFCKARGGEPADFFDSLDMLDNWDRFQRREKVRRKANKARAVRLHNRLNIVRDYDVWTDTAQIEDTWDRYEQVKRAYRKKARLLWVLTALYQYWMFDYSKVPVRNDMTFSNTRKRYNRYLKQARDAREK